MKQLLRQSFVRDHVMADLFEVLSFVYLLSDYHKISNIIEATVSERIYFAFWYTFLSLYYVRYGMRVLLWLDVH